MNDITIDNNRILFKENRMNELWHAKPCHCNLNDIHLKVHKVMYLS